MGFLRFALATMFPCESWYIFLCILQVMYSNTTHVPGMSLKLLLSFHPNNEYQTSFEVTSCLYCSFYSFTMNRACLMCSTVLLGTETKLLSTGVFLLYRWNGTRATSLVSGQWQVPQPWTASQGQAPCRHSWRPVALASTRGKLLAQNPMNVCRGDAQGWF